MNFFCSPSSRRSSKESVYRIWKPSRRPWQWNWNVSQKNPFRSAWRHGRTEWESALDSKEITLKEKTCSLYRFLAINCLWPQSWNFSDTPRIQMCSVIGVWNLNTTQRNHKHAHVYGTYVTIINFYSKYLCNCQLYLYALMVYLNCAKLFHKFLLCMLRLNSLYCNWNHYRFWYSKMRIWYCSCHICIQIDYIRAVKPIFLIRSLLKVLGQHHQLWSAAVTRFWYI